MLVNELRQFIFQPGLGYFSRLQLFEKFCWVIGALAHRVEYYCSNVECRFGSCLHYAFDYSHKGRLDAIFFSQ